jgi:hypothetical protein
MHGGGRGSPDFIWVPRWGTGLSTPCLLHTEATAPSPAPQWEVWHHLWRRRRSSSPPHPSKASNHECRPIKETPHWSLGRKKYSIVNVESWIVVMRVWGEQKERARGRGKWWAGTEYTETEVTSGISQNWTLSKSCHTEGWRQRAVMSYMFQKS